MIIDYMKLKLGKNINFNFIVIIQKRLLRKNRRRKKVRSRVTSTTAKPNNNIINETRKLRKFEDSPKPNLSKYNNSKSNESSSLLSPSISSSSYLSRPMLALNKKKISPNLFSGLNIHSGKRERL